MDNKKLKIYFTSDTHGYFYPTTYGDLIPKNVGLFSCIPNWKKDENSLVIDGGDVLQGNAFSDRDESCAEELEDISQTS